MLSTVLTAVRASSSSLMSRPQIRPHCTFSNAIFLYKTTNEGGWITLPCSEHRSKYNCCGIRFDGFGVSVTQKSTEHGSACHLKFILKSPVITTENDQLTVEATCVGVSSPDLVSDGNGKDRSHAFEHSRTLPLALIGDTVVAVTLYDLTGSHEGTETLKQEELIELIPSLIEQGFQGWSARHTNGSSESPTQAEIRNATASNTDTMTPSTRHTNGSSESTTQPEIRNATVSNTGQTMTPRTAIPRSRHPKKRYNPNAQTYHPSLPSAGSHGIGQVAGKPTLEQRLKAHQMEVTATELWIRQRLEDDRHAMLNQVTRPVTEAINHEFDRMMEEALKEHRARATIIMGKIVAEYAWMGFREG